jgi:radical SAM superfamily enzyme YgiQ (UPF0313 family)
MIGMTDILFGQSYYLRFDPKLWAAMQPYPPLGTLYAAAVARAGGYEVALFDAMLAESEQEWAVRLDQEQPRVAVIYEDSFNYLSKMCLLRMRQAAFTMIAMARARGCRVAVCGSDASDHCEEYLAHGADVVLLGEGEATLAELLNAWLTSTAPTDYQQIAGLAWLESSESRYVRRSVRRPDLRELDGLPFPAWDLVDVERYRRIWIARHGFFSMNMVTTRGCPYHCNWCAKPIWGQRSSSRSPEHVVAELAWLKQQYHPDHIWFVDDIMGLKPGWMAQFADLVEREGVRIPFKCLSRADLLVRAGAVEALARAGCQIVWIGAESGSQKILDAMEKGTRVEQIHEAARRLHAAGVRVGFFLQFGYPGEDRSDIEQTLAMVRACRPDDIGMSVSYPLPGTPFYERVRGELGTKQNWQDSDDLAMLYEGPFPTQFYRQLHRRLHCEFRARKACDALRTTPGLRGRVRAALALIWYTLRLPIERMQLELQARIPHTGLGPITQGMRPEEAARPTPQE